MEKNYAELFNGSVICLDNITHIIKYKDTHYEVFLKNKTSIIISNNDYVFIKQCLKKISNSYQISYEIY